MGSGSSSPEPSNSSADFCVEISLVSSSGFSPPDPSCSNSLGSCCISPDPSVLSDGNVVKVSGALVTCTVGSVIGDSGSWEWVVFSNSVGAPVSRT